MPENTVYVGRGSKWGNPFPVNEDREPEEAVNAYEWWIREQGGHKLLADIAELCGKNLACWCPLDMPCHAEVLLKLARDVEHLVTKRRRGRCNSPQDIPCYFFAAGGCYASHFCDGWIKE